MRRSLVLFLLILSGTLSAQKSEKEKIVDVVKQVFVAMNENDSVRLKQAFTESPALYTVFKNAEGIVQLRTGNFERFVRAVGQPKSETWSEPVWNEKVEVDGSLAQVWVDYAFFLNEELLHCGVDAFHLVKMDGQWRIFHLVDTRRKKNCVVPDDLRPKLKE